jgi:hypothetical protein
VTFDQVLLELQNSLGINIDAIRPPVDKKIEDIRMGPSIRFSEVKESRGGFTPPNIMHSDSECALETTPTTGVVFDHKRSSHILANAKFAAKL